MKKNISLLLILFITGTLISCNKKFLDVSDELAEERNLEQVFSTPQEVRRFHRFIYTGVPNSLDMWWNSLTGLNNAWPFLSDELKMSTSAFTEINGITSSNVRFSRWGLYKHIRQANLFLENVVEIPKGGFAEYLDMKEVNELKAQARFFRAYYHYLLFELYGPIPIMDKTVDPSVANLDFERNSVDEVVAFIYSELTAVANDLKDPDLSNREMLAVPTKGTALAVRARLMVYAASPLFNGGFSEALSLTNHDGKRLFPDNDHSKWGKALEAVQAFMDYSVDHYELYKEYTDGVYDADKTIYELFTHYNKEVIFARSDMTYAGGTGNPVPRGARGGDNTSGNVGVRQELVDAFFMNDGLSIEESPLYTEDGFSTLNEDLTGRTEPGDHRMFINREPRFYNTVFYNGRHWHIGNEQIWFNRGGNSDNSATFTAKTGHLLYKRTSQRVYAAGDHPRTEYKPAFVFRLAEFYLLYAEVLNEVDPGNTKIIEYVDKIRERAGIPLLKDIKPEIIGDQHAQREAIRAESRVELATEGQRFFDINRWMIAEELMDENAFAGDLYGMDMDAPTLEGFYNRVVVDHKVWRRAMYLHPITLSDIQKSELLVQNPGY